MKNIIIAKNSGFCFGVQNAVDIALKNSGKDIYILGELIHNETVLQRLKDLGVRTIQSIDDISSGKVIIRSHGVGKSIYDALDKKGIQIIDATCPFVKKIHKIVDEHYNDGFQIVIIGTLSHPEVDGINGWCDNSAIIIDEQTPLDNLKIYKKLCFVAQTTYSVEKYDIIVKKIQKHCFNLVEIFDTICYTTSRRQDEAAEIAAKCDSVLIVGSKTSSNTNKLYQIAQKYCKNCFLVENAQKIKNNYFMPYDTIGIVAGASTPKELIMEVKRYMSQQFEEVQSQEFIDAVEESLVNYKEGKRIKGTVISADEKGISVVIGGKKDGLIMAEEVNLDGEYNPADFAKGAEIEAIIISKQDKESGCVLLSKKKLDLIKEGDKQVETIRNGEVFEFKIEKETKGGLLGKMGTYTLFVPASHIREGFVKDLKAFVGKTLRLSVIEIDDAKRKVVASARNVIEKERKEREEIFWSHVQPNVIVSGKVKRVTNFGAFVSVDGFDCLAHIVDLSWNHIKNVEEVLTIGKTYDFIVLNVDKEKGRVSLSYKLLQAHPFTACIDKHPIGSICKGKVTSIVPFGAFVEIEPGIEGLVHVSEAAHTYVKNIAEVIKVGEEVDVMILNADPASKRITLSIKACKPEEAPAPQEADENPAKATASTEKQPKAAKPSKAKSEAPEADKEWSDDSKNNPFAELFKDLDIK